MTKIQHRTGSRDFEGIHNIRVERHLERKTDGERIDRDGVGIVANAKSGHLRYEPEWKPCSPAKSI